MNQITENLYITDAPTVRKMDADHEFDRIVTLGYYNGMGYEKPELSTDEHVFPDGPHDYDAFKTATDLVRDSLDAGERVLVHCQAGVSRSASVCSAVLAVREGESLDDALMQVRVARPRVDPTPELWASAERYVAEAAE